MKTSINIPLDSMCMSPKVSVIIIFLNEEAYLAQAVESVFQQTYSDWELILVDDGSTDHSSMIAQALAEQQPNRVRYLTHVNHGNFGISASRNLGIKYSRGQYVGFLDADDLWMPDKLQQQVTVLDEFPQVAMTFGRIHFFSQDRNISVEKVDSALHVPALKTLYPPIVLHQAWLGENGILTTPGAILFRRSALEEVGGCEESFRGFGDDLVLWSKITMLYPVYALNDCMLLYRRHSKASGILDSRARTVLSGQIRAARWLYDYTSKQPDSVQTWAIPIAEDALFKSYLNEAWGSSDRSSRWFIIRRRICLLAMWKQLRCTYPSICNNRHVLLILGYILAGARSYRILKSIGV